MNIYLISQNQNNGTDTYDSAVVVAKDESIAATLNPRTGKVMTDKEWKDPHSNWCSSPSKVKVELIGLAKMGLKQGLICSSFNAG